MSDASRTVTFPRSRLATADVGRYGRDAHVMFGLLEVDVTAARRAARELRRSGQGVSFTAWMIKAIADSVARHPEVHAVAAGRRRVVIFDGVDVALPVERTVEQGRAPLPVVIRDAGSRSVFEINRDIEAARGQEVSDERGYVLGRHGLSRLTMQLYYLLPQPLRLLGWRILFGSPARARRHTGTITVTTVGGAGRTTGWILPTRSLHNLAISIGSITKKPWVVGGAVEVREVMHLTVAFNHDVIDGVPARRFMDDLVSRIGAGRLDGDAGERP
jgi:pyruvate/2-oxoglutarate dehydrogenase complex dihydrolipoamide acyltransferase (E2) component